MYTHSKKAFTLVEIMIVVVIIGLLAAMAIPAFQKVRASSLQKTVLNDARQIGSAAQQYMMEYGTTYADITVANGVVQGHLSNWVKQISKNTTLGGSPITSTATSAFTLKLNGAFGTNATALFDAEGKMTGTQ